MKIFENQFATYIYHKESSLFEEIWHETTRNMKDEELKETMIELVKLFKTYRPTKYFCNLQNFYYTVVPEIQEWIDINVGKIAVEVGLKYKANVISKDIFAAVSVQQTMEEPNTKVIDNQYFEEESDAWKWIKSVG